MSVTRAYAEAFFDAMMTRDLEQIAPYVADDAEWPIVGPIELFPIVASISASTPYSRPMAG
jgi:hypothetical protein